MSRVATLKESRENAREELQAVTERFDAILAERALTPEEETELKAAEKRYEQVAKQYRQAKKAEARAAEEEEERTRKLGQTGEVDVRDGFVHVGNEPLTYSQANPQNSFYGDLLRASQPASPAFDGARARLMRHMQEVAAVASYSPSTKEGRAAVSVLREVRRKANVQDSEMRSVSTASTSMGDFAPPLYFLSEYAPYRTYGRTFIDQLKHHPMPETGMTFNVPKVTTPTQAKKQTTQNTTVSTRTMVATYDTGVLQTYVDNLYVSQQYLDRVGPGVGGDQIVRDDQQRQVNRGLNISAWTLLFAKKATVGAVLYNQATAGFKAGTFNLTVHKAKAAISKTDGTVAYPTHFITTVDLWESIEGAYDTQKRPYVVPQGVAFNPLAVGDVAAVPEGYTGFRFAGLQAFKDQALMVSWKTNAAGSSGMLTDHPAVLGDLSIAAYWLEGTPVIRVLPQPKATQLTVLIQEYVYNAFILVYPKAIQLVFGSGTAASKLA